MLLADTSQKCITFFLGCCDHLDSHTQARTVLCCGRLAHLDPRCEGLAGL